jgi:hypothetical protein
MPIYFTPVAKENARRKESIKSLKKERKKETYTYCSGVRQYQASQVYC